MRLNIFKDYSVIIILQFFIFQLIFSSFSLGNIFAETVELKLSTEDVIMTAFRKLGEQSTINKL